MQVVAVIGGEAIEQIVAAIKMPAELGKMLAAVELRNKQSQMDRTWNLAMVAAEKCGIDLKAEFYRIAAEREKANATVQEQTAGSNS
jgi:hypothetical protein